ncbi:MAG: MFS transporter [Gammaproteobacteria bacterium]|jgi:MFS family permease
MSQKSRSVDPSRSRAFAGQEHAGEELFPRLLLPLLFLGVLMGALDIAIVGPALPAIRESFDVDESDLSWVFSVFTLFAVISAVPLARLSDRFGRRRIYVLSLSVFTTGSLLVALAPSFGLLIAARAVQALGAGGIFPVASAVIGDVVPVERRGRALGMIGAVFGIAFLLGPLIGGLLLPLGWQSLFLINLPIGLLLILAAARVLPDVRRTAGGSLDWAGMLLLAATLVSVAVGFNRITGLSEGSLQALGFVVVPLAAAAALAWALARIERSVPDPIIPPVMFASVQMRRIAAVALVAGFVESAMVFLPVVAVSGLQVTDAQAAWMMLPLVVALTLVAPLAGIAVDRWNAPGVIRIGLVTLTSGLLVFAIAPFGLSSFYAAGCLVGAGLAALLGSPLRHAALAAAGPEHRGVGQGLMSLALHSGQIVGAAAIGAFIAAQPAGQTGFRTAMFWLACIAAVAVAIRIRQPRPAHS